MAKSTPITTPAHKYGPTGEYGDCEVAACNANARATCATCDGHFCLEHAGHERHASES
jgi:predicted nucleic acid binding AN1-type Zn finger protein